MSLKYNNNNIEYAKKLRKTATKQENHLWYDFLSTYPVRFQRQKAIDNFIVDFYCHAAKLIIELDGSPHRNEERYADDEQRTAVLEKYGLLVVRYSDDEIDGKFSGVCCQIDKIVKDR